VRSQLFGVPAQMKLDIEIAHFYGLLAFVVTCVHTCLRLRLRKMAVFMCTYKLDNLVPISAGRFDCKEKRLNAWLIHIDMYVCI
jgi:hypothetical protein